MSKQVYHKTKASNGVLIPIMLMIGFIPMIVHMYKYNSNLSQFDWFPANSDSQVEFFFGWKMVAIVLIGIVMAGFLLYRYFKKKEEMRFETSFYFLFFYGLFVVMSALFSGYKYWVVRGTYELLEPVWCVLAYILLCYYTYQYVREEKQLKCIFVVAGIGMLIVTLIGVFQYFKLDFFKSSIGKHLITNPSWWNELDSINFNMADGTAYTTLYNPNFLSFYFGMLVPLIACFIIATKKIWQKLLLAVAEVFCLICLKGSGSDTGWMAVVVGVVLIALILCARKKKVFCTGIAIIVIGGIIVLAVGSKSSFVQRIKDTILGTYNIESSYELQSFATNDDNVELNIGGNILRVSYGVNEDGSTQLYCEDGDSNSLQLNLGGDENNIYTIEDARFSGVYICMVALGDDNIPAASVNVDGVEWQFVNVQDQGYYFCNYAGKLVKWSGVKEVHLFKDDAMSGRGHIWNMTIPLLGKHVFIGSGANTYMMEYPQDDYIGQQYIYANGYEVKAHCWYLQQWVETGLIGTLALLIFVIWYVVRSVKIYCRVNLHESISWIGIGLFAAVLVYLIAAIANDSNVCTAPVFWGMLGLGLAVNRIIAGKENLFTKKEVSRGVAEKQTEIAENVTQKEAAKEAAGVAKPKQTSNKKQSRKQRKNQKK